jgi:hypothetical protein
MCSRLVTAKRGHGSSSGTGVSRTRHMAPRPAALPVIERFTADCTPTRKLDRVHPEVRRARPSRTPSTRRNARSDSAPERCRLRRSRAIRRRPRIPARGPIARSGNRPGTPQMRKARFPQTSNDSQEPEAHSGSIRPVSLQPRPSARFWDGARQVNDAGGGDRSRPCTPRGMTWAGRGVRS